MGNICRSPTAEGVFRKLITEQKLVDHFEIDSAGTIADHQGKASDHRAIEAAKKRGINLSAIRARQIVSTDFGYFDYVLVMDSENYQNLMLSCPDEHRNKVQYFLDYAANRTERNVPDPYFGGVQGFENVLDLIEEAALGLYTKIVASHTRQ